MKKFLIASILLLTIKVPGNEFIHDDNFVDVMAVELESAKSAILMEVETKEVIFEYNAHERRSPASMTKIMTMKLVMDAINSQKLSMDDVLTTSEYASSMGGSQIFLSANEQMKVEDLFKSMVIASANDAAVVLAEAISGSEDNFTKLMNHTATKLGCKNTTFQNATGLPTEDHLTTCYDMAVMSCSLLQDYEEEVIKYSSKYEDYIRTDTDNPFWLVNTNKLLKTSYGIDGLKTGWTNDAGYCITTTMKKDGMRLVCVIMGAETPTLRNKDAVSVLNYGFCSYELVVLKDKGEIIETNSNILLDPSDYNIVTNDKICFLKYKNQACGNFEYVVEVYHDKIRKLEEKNIGVLHVYLDGKLVGESSLDLETIPRKTTFLELLYKVFCSFFN